MNSGSGNKDASAEKWGRFTRVASEISPYFLLVNWREKHHVFACLLEGLVCTLPFLFEQELWKD